MPSPASISVIMPCYNAAAFLDRSVGSVLAQSHQGLELIAVDDGSSDDTLERLKAIADPRVKVITTDHGGVCHARNSALKVAEGEFVAFLDADDRWDWSFLEKLLLRLSQQPDAVIAYCGWQNIGLEGAMAEPFVPPELETPDKAETLLKGCPWPIHAALTRRSAIADAGGFDPRFAIGEDYLLWLSIAITRPVVRVPEVLAYYYHHGGPRASTNKDRVALETWRVQRAFLSEQQDKLAGLDPARLSRVPNQQLMNRGFDCYWNGDLEAARAIFRQVMRQRFGGGRDWLYMLPSWLPLSLHGGLLRQARKAPEQ